MRWINNFRMSTRIILSFGAAALIIALAGLFANGKLHEYSVESSGNLGKDARTLQSYNDLYALSLKIESASKDALYGSADNSDYQSAANEFTKKLQSVARQNGSDNTNLLQEISDIWSSIQQSQAQAQSSIGTRRRKQDLSSLGNLKAQYSNLSAKVATLIDSDATQISQEKTGEISSANQIEQEFWLVSSLLIIAIIITGFIWYRSLTVPLKVLTEATRKISAGKWGARAEIKSKNEFGILAESFNAMSADIAKLAAYLNEVGGPVYAVDRQFTIQFANTAAVKLAGENYENIVEKKCYEVFKLPLCQTAECPVSKAWNERKMISGESTAKPPKGGEIPVIYQASSISDVDGNIIRGVAVLTDVTEIKAFSDRIEKDRKYLSESVDALLKEMNKFAEGDLTVGLEAKKNDEIGKLYQGFNKVVLNIREIIGQVIRAVQSTASASSQISSSTEELAAGAQEQSAQAGEVATAVEQMTRTVIENARSASKAVDAAKDNGKVAHHGGEVVQNTVQKIKEIANVVRKSSDTVNQLGELSGQIGEIVSVIDDIADQTNLLALNAAIEAARAGEEGRGFAVVADEVRKLAERTSQATKQISAMIRNIQNSTGEAVEAMRRGNQEVTEGISLADQAGDSLKNIVSNAQGIVDMINQIAAASEEQSSTSEQISKNVEAISTVSSESANGISQIARAADDLNRLTESLQKLADKFKVDQKDNSRINLAHGKAQQHEVIQ